MFRINRQQALHLIIVFALINSSIFIGLRPTGFSPLRIAIASFLLLSGLLLVICFFRDIIKNNVDVSLYFKVLFAFLFLWSIITCFRSLSLNAKDTIALWGHYLMAWAWLTPLAVVIGLSPINWQAFFRYLGRLLAMGIVISIASLLFSENARFGALEWLYFYPLLILTYPVQTKSNKIIGVFSVASFLFISLLVSQRANYIYTLLIAAFASIEFLRRRDVHPYRKAFYLSVILLVLFVSSLLFNKAYSAINSNEQLAMDTRTFLFLELFDDLSRREVITGRGALGTYYSPYFESWEKTNLEGDSSARSVAEVGYLEMILKGGSVMVLLYLLILVPAAYLGIFRSGNHIGRMCGYFILSYLVLWTVSYYPTYSPRFIIVWMAAGACISSRVRNMICMTSQEHP